MTRIFQRTFRLVTSSWHMYFVGFLFGLGFDTATEVGLLGISASAANRGPSLVDDDFSCAVYRRDGAGGFTG